MLADEIETARFFSDRIQRASPSAASARATNPRAGTFAQKRRAALSQEESAAPFESRKRGIVAAGLTIARQVDFDLGEIDFVLVL